MREHSRQKEQQVRNQDKEKQDLIFSRIKLQQMKATYVDALK